MDTKAAVDKLLGTTNKVLKTNHVPAVLAPLWRQLLLPLNADGENCHSWSVHRCVLHERDDFTCSERTICNYPKSWDSQIIRSALPRYLTPRVTCNDGPYRHLQVLRYELFVTNSLWIQQSQKSSSSKKSSLTNFMVSTWNYSTLENGHGISQWQREWNWVNIKQRKKINWGKTSTSTLLLRKRCEVVLM